MPRLRVAAFVAAGALIVLAPPLAAQPVSLTPGPPSGERGLIPRYRFHLAAEALATDDPRFDWDADFGDLDFVDYGVGRVTALANYEVLLGEQLQHFDPNQGNYTLDLSTSLRWRRAEFAAVFHHISRHLSDRPKPFPIDWNMVGALRASYDANGRATHLQIDGRALWTVSRSYVDYAGELGFTVALLHDLDPRVSFVANTEAYVLRVVEASSSRAAQNGGRVEGGIRIAGSKGVIEFIAGYERRVDADPFEGRPMTWGYFGFRLLSAS